MLALPSLSERFSAIYTNNLWESAESKSGLGSEITFTLALRSWLVEAIPKLSIKTVVDAPCGDFNWIKELLPHTNVHYIGLDIVGSLIEENNKNFASDRIRFATADICSDTIPQCDLLLIRDCLFHLSIADIDKVLRNLANTNYKYLLTSTHINTSDFRNKDIVSGGFRRIDLFAHPFNFDEKHVIERVNDSPEGFAHPRQMVLFRKCHVPSAIAMT